MSDGRVEHPDSCRCAYEHAFQCLRILCGAQSGRAVDNRPVRLRQLGAGWYIMSGFIDRIAYLRKIHATMTRRRARHGRAWHRRWRRGIRGLGTCGAGHRDGHP
jgi:hypothetical protein